MEEILIQKIWVRTKKNRKNFNKQLKIVKNFKKLRIQKKQWKPLKKQLKRQRKFIKPNLL